MGDSPFFNLPVPTLGPQLFAAPSAGGANNFAPAPITLIPLIAYANKLANATMALKSLVDDVLPKVTVEITGALAAIRAATGVADAMDDTLPFRPQLAPDIVAKCHDLKAKSHSLLTAAMNKVGADADPRKLIPELDGRVRDAIRDVVDLLRDPAHVTDIKAFAEDDSIPVQARYMEIWYLGTLQGFAVDTLARTDKSDEVDRIANEVLLQGDAQQSAPAITIAKGKTLWDAFVAATQTATGTVGNLPAPDSLSIALVKCYGAFRLPKAALSQATAGSLEGEIFDLLTNAVKLTSEQKTELRGRLDELKSAQRDVIKAAKAEAETAQRLPDHQARIDRKTRQRQAAEENCRQKAQHAGEFYEDTYGPKNEELYGDLQRGPVIDSFVSVLAIIQFYAAFKELDDPDVPGLQKFADFTASGIISIGAVVSTVGRLLPKIDIGIAKCNLAALGKLAESLGTKIAVYAGAMAILSGGVTFYIGWVQHDPEKMVIGGLTVGSGAAIVAGALLASAVLTGIGVGIGVLLAAYCAFEALSDAMKNATEKAIDSILDSLKQRLSYRGKTVIQYLGLEAQLAAVKDALDGWSCFELRPNPAGSPTRQELTARIKGLGFKDDFAAKMVESADADVDLPPMLVVP